MEGTWTRNFDMAENFRDIEAALNAVQHLKLEGVEYVLMMGDAPSIYDVSMPFVLNPEAKSPKAFCVPSAARRGGYPSSG